MNVHTIWERSSNLFFPYVLVVKSSHFIELNLSPSFIIVLPLIFFLSEENYGAATNKGTWEKLLGHL